MTLRDLMSRQAPFLASTSYHGEELTYHPVDGEDKTIRAVVRRLGRVEDENSDVEFLAAELWIPNDATIGLTTRPADGDQVTLALQFGGTPILARIVRTVTANALGFLCEVRG